MIVLCRDVIGNSVSSTRLQVEQKRVMPGNILCRNDDKQKVRTKVNRTNRFFEFSCLSERSIFLKFWGRYLYGYTKPQTTKKRKDSCFLPYLFPFFFFATSTQYHTHILHSKIYNSQTYVFIFITYLTLHTLSSHRSLRHNQMRSP